MTSQRGKTTLRRLYPRLTEHGLEQEFNVKSQAHESCKLIRTCYDDGGYSGGSMERPALQRLLDWPAAGLTDTELG